MGTVWLLLVGGVKPVKNIFGVCERLQVASVVATTSAFESVHSTVLGRGTHLLRTQRLLVGPRDTSFANAEIAVAIDQAVVFMLWGSVTTHFSMMHLNLLLGGLIVFIIVVPVTPSVAVSAQVLSSASFDGHRVCRSMG
jgi:hypothetical protein